MENITSAVALKNAIELLEIEMDVEGRLLKEQFYYTVEAFKPANLLRNTIQDVVSSPHLIDEMVGTAVGMATGFVSNKIVTIGSSGNLVRKLFGAVLQLGVTTIVAQHPYVVKYLGKFIFNKILRKKEKVLPRFNESEL